jgi:type III restriction enzyme
VEFQFDPNQGYQLDAVMAVVDLFQGQPSNSGWAAQYMWRRPQLRGFSRSGENEELFPWEEGAQAEVGAISNSLLLDKTTILENLQAVQDRNGVDVSSALAGKGLDFDVEMETGTGKTYVYLRTIFELAQRYNFTKYVILVPSVAIREGVNTSIKLMRSHFERLYPGIPFDATVYSGKSPEEVQFFATSTNVQIMVLTIDSLRGDKNTRIIHQTRDKLNGLRPIDFLAATQPIVIMDEPQNMESLLSQSAVGELNPTCTLRYSATHRVHRNLVYRLDPVDAHDQGLVKEIVVSDVSQWGTDAKPYIKVLEVLRDPWRVKLELVKGTAAGKKRATVTVPYEPSNRRSLGQFANNEDYTDFYVDAFEVDGVELTNHGLLIVGESIGDNDEFIHREMLRETIREHFRREAQLRGEGIKVLSLFFLDRVANYLAYDSHGEQVEGRFAQWFDELFVEELGRRPQYREMYPLPPADYRKAYFAETRKGGKSTFKDTSGSTKADDDAYELIMRDKAGLLDIDRPTRFIFSHSALREGWDNPNVFQICVLREMGETLERRQTIGRGLRLPVNSEGVRVGDRGVAQLTVVANESYAHFADTLQTEYAKAGVSIGKVRKTEFAKIPTVTAEGQEKPLGSAKSEEVWAHLLQEGFIDGEGVVQKTFVPEELGFTLGLPIEFEPHESQIIDIVANCKIERIVRQKRTRVARRFNKELVSTPEFEEFWRAISQRTTYRVSLNRNKVIAAAVRTIKSHPPVDPLQIRVTKSGVVLTRGGTKTKELGVRSEALAGTYELPDIIKALQEATSLTRRTIVDILIQSGRLGEFIGNPNDFIYMAASSIKEVLADVIVKGIQYERIGGYLYELRELQEDGSKEKDRFLDQLYKVHNEQKTDFDYVAFDSEVERDFAAKLDARQDVRMFIKLPPKFLIPTPVGFYNPDWAIIKTDEDGQDRIYMIRETKSTQNPRERRHEENAKIECGRKHFAAIGIGDYQVSSPDKWNL